MKMTKRPMLATVIYGLLCGVTFIPVVMALSYVLYWPMAFRLTIWLYLAGYLVFLIRWARVSPLAIPIPLLLLFFLVFWGGSNIGFLFFALGILSWVRSGICFQGEVLKAFSAEAALCLGGGSLVAYFSPNSTITWALAVWMFFLVQSLYFVVFRGSVAGDEEKVERDPFEPAKGQVETILSSEVQ